MYARTGVRRRKSRPVFSNGTNAHRVASASAELAPDDCLSSGNLAAIDSRQIERDPRTRFHPSARRFEYTDAADVRQFAVRLERERFANLDGSLHERSRDDRPEPRQRERAVDGEIDGRVWVTRRNRREFVVQRPFERLEIFSGHGRNRKDRSVRGNRPCKLLADPPARIVPALRIDEVDLAYDNEHATHVEELQNLEMLERLRHHAFVCVNDQQQELHAGGSGEHVVKEALVPRHVYDSTFDTIVEAQVREAEVERHAAHALLDQAVGVRSGKRGDQRRLSMVDVSRGSDDVH